MPKKYCVFVKSPKFIDGDFLQHSCLRLPLAIFSAILPCSINDNPWGVAAQVVIVEIMPPCDPLWRGLAHRHQIFTGLTTGGGLSVGFTMPVERIRADLYEI